MLQKTVRITGFDVFPNGSVRPSALQRYMQQLAREDCDQIGCTYAAMREDDMVFVVTKLAVDIKENVRSGDIVTIKTFNNRIEGITFFREYIFTRNGAEVIHATTQWVLVRYSDRTLLRPSSLCYPIPDYNFDCGSIDIPRRLFVTSEDFVSSGSREVMLSDLDENNHLNNCVYSDIALDCLPCDSENERVSKLVLIFQHEARRGDILNIAHRLENNAFLIKASNESTDKPCFEAMITLDKI